MRIEQPAGTRGSLKWIQRLVQHHPDALTEQLTARGALAGGRSLVWASPLASDSFAEYRDEDFLSRIGLERLSSQLAKFWPNRGPQWDALASDDHGRVFLVEAKAHAAEMTSTCQAGKESRARIVQACDAAKRVLGASPTADWLSGYYQYANRLAHLGFLREHNVDAWLVFLYFTGDADMKGPGTETAWAGPIRDAHTHLGLPAHPPGVVSAFQSVSTLA